MKHHGLRVGASEACITPKGMGVELSGFAGRHPFAAAGVHDPIQAHCLALSDGDTDLLLVSLDLLAFSVTGAGRMKAEVAKATGIPAQHIMLATTHTHSGPATVALRYCGKVSPAYVRFVRGQTVRAARQACRSRVPVRMRAAHTRAWLGMNRREADPDRVRDLTSRADLGNVDPQVGALGFEDAHGRTRAIVVNYGMHPVCLGAENRLISADYPAYLYSFLKREFGEAAVVVFLNGSAGDVNPRRRDGFRAARLLGTRLGRAAARALKSASATEAGPGLLGATLRRVELPYDLGAARRRARAYLRMESDGDRGCRAQMEWAGRVLAADLRGTLPRFIRAPVQAVRIGPVGVVGAPCELLTRVGEDIRRRGGRPLLWMASCANGDVGYIPAPEDFPRGKYEVETAHLYYDAPPFAQRVGVVLAREAAHLMESL